MSTTELVEDIKRLLRIVAMEYGEATLRGSVILTDNDDLPDTI